MRQRECERERERKRRGERKDKVRRTGRIYFVSISKE